jgi:Flp pilus assembly protein TadD
MGMLGDLFGKKKLTALAAKAASPSPPPAASKKDTSTRTKPKETSRRTKSRVLDDQALVVRGRKRQAEGDHDGAIADFTKAIELNAECFQAYEARGVSRERKGDTEGAKSDYMRSISIQVNAELSRQMRENPDVSV